MTTAQNVVKVFVVDDDPSMRLIIKFLMEHLDVDVSEFADGASCLAALGESPDVVVLDIEMPGMDGIAVSRTIRSEGNAGTQIIFVSCHDDLETRLVAYDAGGNDYIVKPFARDELARKIAIAIRHKCHLDTAIAESRSSLDTAMTAITSLGDIGVTLKFNRSALGCRTLDRLAAITIESMAAFGIDCHVQLRTTSETLTLTPHGPASPLEESVMEKSRTMDRIFSFSNRLIINYDNVSLLVPNMPITNDDLCGRIRDQAAIIAEAAELAVGNIELRSEAIKRTEELRKLAVHINESIEELRSSYRVIQEATRVELEAMASTIETMYVHLGLTDNQEFTISDTVRNSVDRVLELLERSSELDRNFTGICEDLIKASEYTVTQEDEPSLTVELW